MSDTCNDKCNNEDINYDKIEDELQATFHWFDKDHLEDISDHDTICANNYENEEFTKTDTKPPP